MPCWCRGGRRSCRPQLCARLWLAGPLTLPALSCAPPPPHPPPCSLLGWPIQFLGLVVTPYLALRYFVKKEADPLADAEVRRLGWVALWAGKLGPRLDRPWRVASAEQAAGVLLGCSLRFPATCPSLAPLPHRCL